jgi:hypothetical protein
VTWQCLYWCDGRSNTYMVDCLRKKRHTSKRIGVADRSVTWLIELHIKGLVEWIANMNVTRGVDNCKILQCCQKGRVIWNIVKQDCNGWEYRYVMGSLDASSPLYWLNQLIWQLVNSFVYLSFGNGLVYSQIVTAMCILGCTVQYASGGDTVCDREND